MNYQDEVEAKIILSHLTFSFLQFTSKPFKYEDSDGQEGERTYSSIIVRSKVHILCSISEISSKFLCLFNSSDKHILNFYILM